MKLKSNILLVFDMPDKPNYDLPYADQFHPDDWINQKDIIEALRYKGHDVNLAGLYDTLTPLFSALEKFKPDIIFNLLESYNNQRTHESHITGIFELLGIPYTGASPTCLALCKNKLYTKRLLAPHRIKVPRATFFPFNQRSGSLKKLNYPVFVKPLACEGSDGIAQSSFAENKTACLERVKYLHNHFKSHVIVEEYIEGREIYVSILGNKRLSILPYREMIFHDFPESRPKFASFKAKWDEQFRKKWGIRNTFASVFPPDINRKIKTIARSTFRALGMHGYGRLDLRVTPHHEIYVIEANPNPALNKEDEVAQSAIKAGINYSNLIDKILHFGYSRSQL